MLHAPSVFAFAVTGKGDSTHCECFFKEFSPADPYDSLLRISRTVQQLKQSASTHSFPSAENFGDNATLNELEGGISSRRRLSARTTTPQHSEELAAALHRQYEREDMEEEYLSTLRADRERDQKELETQKAAELLNRELREADSRQKQKAKRLSELSEKFSVQAPEDEKRINVALRFRSGQRSVISVPFSTPISDILEYAYSMSEDITHLTEVRLRSMAPRETFDFTMKEKRFE